MSERPSVELGERSPIVVATDGREQSDGAVRAGALFGESMGGWRIVSAAPTVYTFTPELDLGITALAIEQLRDQQRRAVETQIRRVLGASTRVEVDVVTGGPAEVIATAAKKVHAPLIVSGLGRQRLVDRLLGDETALAIIRMSEKPVLAVPQEFADVPRDAVVGVDFSEASIRAAQLTLKIISGAATIYLLHVAPREDVLSIVSGGFAAYQERASAELASVVTALSLSPRMHAQVLVRQGDPGSELLHYAKQTGAQLIAVGTRGQKFIERLLLGSVATKVVRASPIPVLVTPPEREAAD